MIGTAALINGMTCWRVMDISLVMKKIDMVKITDATQQQVLQYTVYIRSILCASVELYDTALYRFQIEHHTVIHRAAEGGSTIVP